MPASELDIASVDDLQSRLGFAERLEYPDTSRAKPLDQWKMEIDDAPIFRYIYRNLRPRRHLEFGTWEGTGATYCLQECEATIWTLNLPEGEMKSDGTMAYSSVLETGQALPPWSPAMKLSSGQLCIQTDSGGFIGRFYREQGFGHRVCQIYCDSRKWDTTNYPPDFFDSVLIDGGHTEEVVTNDTSKALALLRPGGLCMWHDFCPDPSVLLKLPTSVGVVRAIANNWEAIRAKMRDIFWIRPSFILLGIRSGN